VTDELRADRKIADLRARVARVRELLPASYEVFVESRTEAEALILNRFLALQCASDLALHTVADRGIAVPADARSAFEALARAGIVEVKLARSLAAAVGLRNRIAHEYGLLDLRLVYEAARDDLGDLEALAAALAARA
jgi:uncharacterized protein YutE (UPF0331/DUF86 family)